MNSAGETPDCKHILEHFCTPKTASGDVHCYKQQIIKANKFNQLKTKKMQSTSSNSGVVDSRKIVRKSTYRKILYPFWAEKPTCCWTYRNKIESFCIHIFSIVNSWLSVEILSKICSCWKIPNSCPANFFSTQDATRPSSVQQYLDLGWFSLNVSAL